MIGADFPDVYDVWNIPVYNTEDSFDTWTVPTHSLWSWSVSIVGFSYYAVLGPIIMSDGTGQFITVPGGGGGGEHPFTWSYSGTVDTLAGFVPTPDSWTPIGTVRRTIAIIAWNGWLANLSGIITWRTHLLAFPTPPCVSFPVACARPH